MDAAGLSALVDVYWDAIKDTLTLIPFLFLTYLAMEALEHGARGWSERVISRAGKAGPFVGSLVGAIPQCGFSAMASALFSARVITLGTLFSVYLSTSDEMLPVFLSQASDVGIQTIVAIIAFKVVVGFLLGYAVDFVLRVLHVKPVHEHIHTLCEQDQCGCGEHHHHSIVLSALKHTAQVSIFIFFVLLLLDLSIAVAGEDALKDFMAQSGIASIFLSAIVGLIPNCAASVAISELYLTHVLSASAMISGLLVGAGVGLLVLFRSNRPMWQNFCIAGVLYLLGVGVGLLVYATGLTF